MRLSFSMLILMMILLQLFQRNISSFPVEGIDETDNAKNMVTMDRSGRTLKKSSQPPQVRNPLSFTTSRSYLVTKFRIYNTFSIKFMMKTIEANGLLMYSGFPSNDFMALEMVNGKLRYIFDVGSGPRLLQAAKHRKPKRRQDHSNQTQTSGIQLQLNDNIWHRIHLYRPSLEKHVLEMDGVSFVDYLPDSRSVFYDLIEEDLFVGGVPDELITNQSLTTQVESMAGYRGCLASIQLDDNTWSAMENVTYIPEKFKESVIKECPALSEECEPNTCLNGGKCVQKWFTTECDCNMTSFVGRRCNQSSLGFEFRSSGACILLRFAPEDTRDTRKDEVVFGIQTSQDNRAVLVRLSSFTSRDFITIEMDDGLLYVIYNMGKVPHRIDSKSTIYSSNREWNHYKINDGKYHVIRFIRNSQNSSLKIDDNPVLTKHPTGKQLSVFNELSAIQIGGSTLVDDVTGPIISKPYRGSIYGLSVNGLRVLDMVSNGDPRMAVIGDAVEINHNDSSPYTATSATTTTVTTTTTIATTSVTLKLKSSTDDVQMKTNPTQTNAGRTNLIEICTQKKYQNAHMYKLCQKNPRDDGDVTSSGMKSDDDEDMIVGIDARQSYESIEFFYPTIHPSTRHSAFPTETTKSKKVRIHTIHQWVDPEEEYLKNLNLNFTFANVRPPVQRNVTMQSKRNYITDNFMHRMTLNFGLLVGSMVVLTALLLFLLTILFILKQRQRFSRKWKTLDNSLKTSVTQDSEKFHNQMRFDDAELAKQSISIKNPDDQAHLYNGSLHNHQVVKKINSKEWYV